MWEGAGETNIFKIVIFQIGLSHVIGNKWNIFTPEY